MNIDIHKLDEDVLQDILNGKSYDCLTPEGQKELEASLCNSSVAELMDAYLNWNGIIGYTSDIIRVYESIKASRINNPIENLISYLWDDEYLSYMEENGLNDNDDCISHAIANPDQGHIFCSLARLHTDE